MVNQPLATCNHTTKGTYPMMHLQLAGSGVMSAYYPPESELHRKVRQLIRAAMLRLKDTLSQPGVPAHDHFTR